MLAATFRILPIHVALVLYLHEALERDNNYEIQLFSKRASSKHAKIYKIGSEYHISDIGSTNGTYVGFPQKPTNPENIGNKKKKC